MSDGFQIRDAPETDQERLARLRSLRSSMPDAPQGDRDYRGARLDRADLSGLDLSAFDLRDASLVQADLREAQLTGAQLQGANLYAAQASGAEFLNADLSETDLTDFDAPRAGFGGANLAGARMLNANFSKSTFSKANLQRIDARGATWTDARLIDADLTQADLARANLGGADLQNAIVTDSSFREADLRHARLRNVQGYASADWIQADIVDTDFTNAYLARREILDQNYLHEFRHCSRTHALLYHVWWATSDCGRSFVRWGMWTALIAFVFAWIYTQVGIDFGENATSLSPFYFSVVTLTTLGYGDVLPTTVAGQICTMIQVILGYVMLGGLLSIFSNKMARRAE